MNIELDEIKKFLSVFKESEQPYLNIKSLAELLDLKADGDDIKKIYHYLMILKDQELIEGVNLKPEQQNTLGFTFHGKDIIWANISVMLRLTYDGHKVLETLSQSKFWEASKKQFQILGVEGLKLIPNLAVEFIKSSLDINF